MTSGCGKDNFSWYAQTFNVLMFLFFVNIVSFNALWKFLRLGNSAWDFFGVDVWSRDFRVDFLFQLMIVVAHPKHV